MNLDIAFICKLLEEPNLAVVKDNGISDDYLFDSSREALRFVSQHFSKYGKMPDKVTLESHLQSPFAESTPEPMSYYVDLLKKRFIGNTVSKGLAQANDLLRLQDMDKALDVLKEVVKTSSASGVIKDTGLVDLRTNTAERVAEYERVKALKGQVDGMPLPWPSINEATMGVHPGELWFVVARLKTGKSWILIQLCDHFFRNGHKVLLVSMEMPVSKMARRLDSLYARIPFGHLKRGTLCAEHEAAYTVALTDFTKPGQVPLWVCGKSRVQSVQDLEMVIEELHPDIVLLDGTYLMRVVGMKSANKWERVSAVADSLQDIAQRKMTPIIATTQFNRHVKRDKVMAGSEDIGFAYEIAQNTDCLIGMFQTDDMREARQMLIRILEHREGEPVNIMTRWDFSTMDFDEFSVVSNDDLNKASGEEERINF